MGWQVRTRTLVSENTDFWLVGGLGIALWGAVRIGELAGWSVPAGTQTVIFWVGAALTAAHFGLSYHLGYGFRAAVARMHRQRMFAIPLVAAVALAAAGGVARVEGRHPEEALAGGAITTVFLLTTWHYLKQTYGVGRVGAAFSGVSLSKREADILRFGLYPLWLFQASQFLRTDNNYILDGYRFGFHLLHPGWTEPLQWLAYASLIPVAFVFLAIRRRGAIPPLLLAAYLAAILWIAFPVNPVAMYLVFAPLHAIQYIAVGHRAELGMALGADVRPRLGWWLNIATAVTAGGLLASRWLPGWVDKNIDPTGPLLFSALFFAFLNLHHYLIDATIWRSGGLLLKSLGRSTEQPVPVAAPVHQPA